MGKWKSRIWKNTDAKTETNPEVDILTGSATGSYPGSVYFTSFFLLLALFFFFLLPIFFYLIVKRQPTKSLLKAEFWPATVVCSVWEASPP